LRPLLVSPKLVLAATAAEANSMNRWLFSLACLSLFFPSPLQADDQPRPSEIAPGGALPFRLASRYLIQVEGRIGDQAHLKFILDTGATISIVGQKIAKKLRLDAHPAQSFNFDRNLQWETATVPEVQFGPVRAANVAVFVGDLARYSEFAGKADAIIGMDLLQLSNFIIDFGAGHLIFDPGPPKTYLAGGDPMTKCLIVELQVQDWPVHLIVDTGLQGILLYEERLRRSVPGLRTSGSIKNATMGGRVPVKQTTLPDVVFGGGNREVPVVFLPSPAPDMLAGIDGIVGIAALHARRVHFDFSGKTLSWE
jgi:predicted aspartyl protease